MENSHTWVSLGIGSIVGGYIPTLWGAEMFSFSSIIFSALGALLGIWIAFRIHT